MQETLNSSVRDMDVDSAPDEASRAAAIERSIAETLLELDTGRGDGPRPGAAPLDEAPPADPSGEPVSPPARQPRRSRGPRRPDHSEGRPIVAALVAVALLALGALGFAFTHGFIP